MGISARKKRFSMTRSGPVYVVYGHGGNRTDGAKKPVYEMYEVYGVDNS